MYPFETTCVFTPEALKAHVAQAVRAFSQSEEGKELRALHEAGKTIKFAGACGLVGWSRQISLASRPSQHTVSTLQAIL